MSNTVNKPRRAAGNTRMEVVDHISVSGEKVPIDMHVYLTDPDDWNKDVALKQAELANIEMTHEHWFVVNYIREQYEYSSCVPEARHAL